MTLTIFYPNEPMISLYVASACQLACQECIMLSQMHQNPKYQMSMEEVENLLEINEISNYKFHYRLTGGEPFLWKNLLPAMRLIKNSKTCLSLSIITNAINISKVNDELIELSDCIRISKYRYNHENCEYLEKKYPDTVLVVDRETFCKNPKLPVMNSIPVDCGNPEIMFYNNRIYACPHAESIAIKFRVDDIKLYNELKPNYKEGLEEIRKTQEKQLCTRCIGNSHVRNAMEKVPNYNSHDPELIQILKK